MKIFKKLFRRNTSPRGGQEGVPLRIEGIPPAPMTPEPDDAEVAAQAVLEMMITPTQPPRGEGKAALDSPPRGSEKGVAYYHALASRIRQAHESERRVAMRYVAYCEQELKKMDDGRGKAEEDNYPLSILNSQLMKHLNTIEREGGELKRRWQHCLADVTVRLMHPTTNDDDNVNDNEN